MLVTVLLDLFVFRVRLLGRAVFWVRTPVPLIAAEHVNGLGFDTTVSFGPDGLGLTRSVLHDAWGPFGTMSQILTVRPRGADR